MQFGSNFYTWTMELRFFCKSGKWWEQVAWEVFDRHQDVNWGVQKAPQVRRLERTESGRDLRVCVFLRILEFLLQWQDITT